MTFGIRLSGRGIVLDDVVWSTGFEDPRQALDRDPFDPIGMNAIVIPWHELVGIEAFDPWPCFRARYRQRAGTSYTEEVIEERPPGKETRDAFAAQVERLFAHVEHFAPRLVQRGWLDAPDVPWEPVKELPGDRGTMPSEGAYRTTTSAPDETIVARRGPPSPFEAMLEWLGSTPDEPFRHKPRELLLTDRHLYARLRDRSCQRLPRQALRTRIRGHSGDISYIFGRRTHVLLPARAECAIAAVLDRQLAGSG